MIVAQDLRFNFWGSGQRDLSWARLLKRVFDIDLEHCPQCGGDLKIIAAIEEPAVIVKILTHQGLPARAPQGGLSFSLWRGGVGCFIGALLCPIDSAVMLAAL